MWGFATYMDYGIWWRIQSYLLKTILIYQKPVILCIYLYELYYFEQIQAGLSALEDALQVGFEDFKVMNQW